MTYYLKVNKKIHKILKGSLVLDYKEIACLE